MSGNMCHMCVYIYKFMLVYSYVHSLTQIFFYPLLHQNSHSVSSPLVIYSLIYGTYLTSDRPTVWPEDFSEEYRSQLPTHPGMNSEEVIIECCRNNWYLCDAEVPRDLVEDFGFLIENEPVFPNILLTLDFISMFVFHNYYYCYYLFISCYILALRP